MLQSFLEWTNWEYWLHCLVGRCRSGQNVRAWVWVCEYVCPNGPEADGQGVERQRIRLWASHNHLASQLSATDVAIGSPAKQPGPHVWPLLSLPGFRLKPGRASWRMGGWGTEDHSMCPGASSLGPLPSMPWKIMCTFAVRVSRGYRWVYFTRCSLLHHESNRKLKLININHYAYLSFLTEKDLTHNCYRYELN